MHGESALGSGGDREVLQLRRDCVQARTRQAEVRGTLVRSGDEYRGSHVPWLVLRQMQNRPLYTPLLKVPAAE